jgi:hypothetical protein
MRAISTGEQRIEEIGNRKEIRSRMTDDRGQRTGKDRGNRKQDTGNRKQERENRIQEIGERAEDGGQRSEIILFQENSLRLHRCLFDDQRNGCGRYGSGGQFHK